MAIAALLRGRQDLPDVTLLPLNQSAERQHRDRAEHPAGATIALCWIGQPMLDRLGAAPTLEQRLADGQVRAIGVIDPADRQPIDSHTAAAGNNVARTGPPPDPAFEPSAISGH